MSIREKEVFTFTWRIESFSMCPQKCGDRLESPVFAVNMLEKTEWRLRLLPRGKLDEKYISCFLACIGSGTSSGEATIDFQIIVSSADVTKQVKSKASNQTFKCYVSYGWDKLVLRNDILCDHGDVYLPNDTLTIVCNMWRTGNDPKYSAFETVLSREIFSTAARDTSLDFRSHFGLNKGSARTQIKVRKRIFSWPIRKFSSLRTNQRLSISLKSPLVDVPFYLTFYFDLSDGDQCVQFEIRRQETDHSHRTFVKCKISVLNILKNDHFFIEETYLFEPEVTDIWKLPSLVKSSQLIEDKYFYVTHDVLRLRCEFAFSHCGDLCEREDADIIAHSDESVSFSIIPNLFENKFKNFYRDGEFSDVRLQVGDRVFKVHKIILSARSSVFSAMFKIDMKEKQTGFVEIADLSANTMDRMLTFMYTGALDYLKLNEAAELYSAADKYEVLQLKFICRSILKSTQSLSNVCDVLRLADLHHDDNLRDAAENFISTNSRHTLQSPEWKYFMKCNPSLAADVMHKMLVQNVN